MIFAIVCMQNACVLMYEFSDLRFLELLLHGKEKF